MRAVRKTIATVVVSLLTVGLALNFSGCSKDMTPIGPEQSKEESTSQQSVDQTNVKKIVTVNNGKVKLLNFTSNQLSLKKLVTQSTLVKPNKGGTLSMSINETSSLELNNYRNYLYAIQTLKAQMTLTVPQHAVNSPVTISVTMDDQISMIGDVDMEFAPHGLVFNTPAILNIEAYNLDLSSINVNDFGTTFGIYYDNEDSGEWEKMDCDDIQINFTDGSVKVINAELPHFSRYAIGAE